MSQPQRLSADDLRARLLAPNPLDMPDGGPPDIDTSPPVSGRQDLVGSTFAAFRDRPRGLRRGALAAELASPAPPPPKARKANAYPGDCPKCDVRVPAGAGFLTKDKAGKWTAEHEVCPTPSDSVVQAAQSTVPATSTEKASQAVIKAVTGQVYQGIHPGIYTVQTIEGHRTFRVRVQGTEEDFAPGKTILEYLIGPDNGKDYVGIAFLNGPRAAFWKRYQDEAHTVIREDAGLFLADPDAALKAVNCIRCNAVLSEPESILVGMGPTCRNKGW